MSRVRIENFFIERNAFVELISESLKLIKHIYRGQNDDINLDCVMYTWERERLLPIINDFEKFYLKYQNLLFLLPKEVFEAEIQFGKKLVRAALDLINSPPDHIRLVVVPIVHTAKPLKIQYAEIVPPICYEVVPQVFEKISHTFIKRVPKFVKVRHSVVVEAVIPFAQEAVVWNKANDILSTCTRGVIEVCDNSCIEGTNITKGTKQSVDFSRLQGGYDFHVNSHSKKLTNILIVQFKFMLRNLKMLMLKKFYNRISLRIFWNYFLFSDFNLYFYKISLLGGSYFFVTKCFVLCLLFMLVKNLFLTVGSVTAVWQ